MGLISLANGRLGLGNFNYIVKYMLLFFDYTYYKIYPLYNSKKKSKNPDEEGAIGICSLLQFLLIFVLVQFYCILFFRLMILNKYLWLSVLIILIILNHTRYKSKKNNFEKIEQELSSKSSEILKKYNVFFMLYVIGAIILTIGFFIYAINFREGLRVIK